MVNLALLLLPPSLPLDCERICWELGACSLSTCEWDPKVGNFYCAGLALKNNKTLLVVDIPEGMHELLICRERIEDPHVSLHEEKGVEELQHRKNETKTNLATSVTPKGCQWDDVHCNESGSWSSTTTKSLVFGIAG